MGQIKVKDLLNICNCDCGPFCVSLLTDRRLKWPSKVDFVHVFQQRAFLRLCVTRGIKRRSQKSGHDILRYVSKFWRSERDNYFFIGKKP